jgi:hypothetical protein
MTGEEPPRRPPLPEKHPKEGEADQSAAPSPDSPAYYRIFSAEPAVKPKRPPDEARARKSRTGMWLVACFVFLLLGVLLGYFASRINAP